MLNNAFESALTNPGHWLLQALDLKYAAEKISPDRCFSGQDDIESRREIMYFHIYKLLLGLSFENLIKGIIIAQTKEKILNDKKFKRKFETHISNNLLSLINIKQCQINESDRILLDGFKDYVLWAGRYPIPKKVEDYKLTRRYDALQYRNELNLWSRLCEYLRGIC